MTIGTDINFYTFKKRTGNSHELPSFRQLQPRQPCRKKATRRAVHATLGGRWSRPRLQFCRHTTRRRVPGRSTHGAVGKARISFLPRGHKGNERCEWCASSPFLRDTNTPPKGWCNTVFKVVNQINHLNQPDT
jgi:hypothetical protein